MDMWELRADWARPHRLPDSYTVTLSTEDANRTVVLHGVSVTVNILDNIIEANKETMDTWEVRASWARPHRLPDSYTVTLSTEDANRTVVLHGVSVTVNILDNIIEANKETMDTWEVRASWARPHRLPDSYTVTLSTEDANRTVVLHGVSVTVNILDNIIEANKETMDTWEVRASWARPHRLPDSYTVTLSTADANRTVVLHGDATDAVFKDVTGEATSSYYVLMQVRLNSTIGYTSRRAQFPDTWEPPGTGGAGGAGGAAIGAGFVGAAALALLCRCRRRRHHVPVPPYKPEDKPTKESDTEVLEIWSETEDRWEVRADKLVLHEVIGEGAFGVVRRATLAPHSVQVAVKMLKDFPSLDEIRSFRSEMELMKSVGVHPHLVSLVGCCSGRRPLIIAEYCSRGDLLSYLRCTWDVMLSKRNAKYYNNNIDISDYRNDLFKCKAQMESSKLVVNKLYELQEICDKELTALDLLSFCRQIAMGMEFLAANRVVHRDLAARNILVTADRTLKIADFGLSRDVYEENQYKQKGNGKMPVKWMAVESLTRRIYTTQSDVWSFGIVVWEIATVGGAPYASVPGARLPRLLRSGYRMPKPNNCSPQLYDIMLSCWRTHPRDRPTFAELHQRLDELLNSACANQYLSLEIDADDAPPTPKHHRYLKMLMSASANQYLSLEIDADDAPQTPKHHRYLKMLMRGKRGWTLSETYERALKPPHANHYTTPPDSISAHPV
ncbi:hypothetical protein PYW07_006008 [Mythimna separata]|uniref:receptor protein-tyrosine kinase n=1 Tax=Mythimna separata TaxID=271217 RepID=A0AAD8DR71_MYTSE|nr:hypothetical protein PYW07_006008 [Mythimna separata]